MSSRSHLPAGPSFPNQDKVLHATYFAGGAFCLTLALFGKRTPLPLLRILLTGFAFAAMVGVLDEWHQTFTPGRSGNDPFDWLADVTGGLMGAGLAFKTLRALIPAATSDRPS